MKALDLMLAQPMVETLGWTLIHFLWQGTLVALLLANLLMLLQRCAANLRYFIACAAMLLMLMLPPVTMWMIGSPSPKIAASRSTITPINMVELRPLSALAYPKIGSTVSVSASPTTSIWQQRLSQRVSPWLPAMISVWLIGVLLCSLRLLTGWLYTQRLKKRGTRPLVERWQQVLQRLCDQLRITRPVRLCESVWVQVPTAIGWLRPVILLPASALTGLTAQQLEAIIAHELAHIRRYDYLVNLLQAVIETLFFYHPAVWWVSRRIRQEREHCCDDLAVGVCGDALIYARALIEMEELRAATPQLAVAANGGSLMNRIHRLVGVQTSSTNRFGGWLASVIVMTAVIGVGAGTASQRPSPRTTQQVVLAAKQEIKESLAQTKAGQTARPEQNDRIQAAEALKPLSQEEPLTDQESLRNFEWPKSTIQLIYPDNTFAPEALRKGLEYRVPVAPDQAVKFVASQATSQATDTEKMKALNSSNPAERAAAACALGRLGAVEAIPALINLLGDDTPIQPIKCGESNHWSPALNSLKQPSPGEQAAIALAALSRPAINPLIAALNHGNASVRRNAAWAIGEVTGVSIDDRSDAVEPLILALSDADPWVRMAAAFSLGELRPRRATEALIAALADMDRNTREMAARALGEMKTRAGVERLTAVLLQDGDERVRRKAAWALGEIKDQQALEALTLALNDQNRGVRETVKWAIAEIRD